MSKKSRGTTKDANRRRERHARIMCELFGSPETLNIKRVERWLVGKIARKLRELPVHTNPGRWKTKLEGYLTMTLDAESR